MEDSLIEFLQRIERLDGEFVIYDDGYRGWTYSHAEIARAAHALRARLRSSGVDKGDAVMIWSESRPGWVSALWGCLLEGVVLVPVDPRSSIELFHKIQRKARPRVILLGDRVPAMVDGTVPVWRLDDIERASDSATLEQRPVALDDIAEIVFTSGTTAEPKGTVITHRNLMANLVPVEGEVAKFRKFTRSLSPLRILNLLPLSHLFGQSLALFLPPLIPASVVFISATGAQEIVRQIKRRRVSALVAVPKLLEVLRDFVIHRFPEVADRRQPLGRWPLRWWRFRRVHRLFGWKFCCFVSGGAPLPHDLEQFWCDLGYLVIQGYGLTETAPIVTLSHPLRVRRGTVGKPLAGVDVQIAEDGEVLVRGDNVTQGYFESPVETSVALRDGWLHTGDIGELDQEGHLMIRGRLKELIITPEGLKVFPDDVERVVNGTHGVVESAVIGKDRVHVVLVLQPGANAGDIVRQANQRLEEHQRIRSLSTWTAGPLPRTPTTRKLRRAEIADAIERGKPEPAKPAGDIETLVQKYSQGRTITSETTLDELGLSSLDRVQLMMDLEQKLDIEIDERVFSSVNRVADLTQPVPAGDMLRFPTANRKWFARLVRRLLLPFFLIPLLKVFTRVKVSGQENLNGLRGPVIFAANHPTLLDVPVMIAGLPSRWRYRLAPGMSGKPWASTWEERLINNLNYNLATFVFNTFPIPPQQMTQTIRHVGELTEQGWSILIFPDGDRIGEIRHFQPGVGMIASQLRLPVVPVRLVPGKRQAHAKFPGPSCVEVRIGEPMFLGDEAFAALARRVEDAVRAL